ERRATGTAERIRRLRKPPERSLSDAVAAVGRKTRLVRPSLGLTRRSQYEDAIEVGERFAAEFDLGDVRAARLVEVVEGALGILVLMVDATEGISGAACR
ncbi:MAG: hypothetical protein OXN84_08325, partial [Albidovulum sp.]|nr:hypothetical protein [Albidovulum sp.]